MLLHKCAQDGWWQLPRAHLDSLWPSFGKIDAVCQNVPKVKSPYWILLFLSYARFDCCTLKCVNFALKSRHRTLLARVEVKHEKLKQCGFDVFPDYVCVSHLLSTLQWDMRVSSCTYREIGIITARIRLCHSSKRLIPHLDADMCTYGKLYNYYYIGSLVYSNCCSWRIG